MKTKLTFLLSLTLLLLLSIFVTLAYTDNFQDGLDASQRGDYKTALEKWKPLAEQGHVTAQYNLGQVYNNGWGVKQDYKEANKWFRLCAEQGVSIAQFILGNHYLRGQGVTEDLNKAVKWYRLSAEQGYAVAQHSLGGIYAFKKEYNEAVKWWKLSAEQGYVEAQFDLGLMYSLGKGIFQDYVNGYMWFIIAEKNGHKDAREAKNSSERNMTPAQITKAQKLAEEWKPKQ